MTNSTLERVLQEHMCLCFQDTGMALELICEALFYEHGLNATHAGRSIYIDDKRVASIKTCVEPCVDARLVCISEYHLI